jgi:sortase (surface protein transpeptidase)
MAERNFIGLDNPALSGRLRQPVDWDLSARADYTARPVRMNRRPYAAVPGPTPPVPSPVQTVPADNDFPRLPQPKQYSRLQFSLVGLAGLVFILGVTVSLQTLLTNHTASAKVSALSKQVDTQAGSGQNTAVPSTTKPSSQSLGQYAVAPDLPRYLKIPKLGVNARVMQVGVNTAGALGSPSNVFDTAWYTGSAKPGQPGATLIDGHVSSWTTHGVFYGIAGLVAGDNLQIVRGDGAVLNYRVVKTQLYPASNVDMKAAIAPVTAGKPGLNLITCAGQVKKGTTQFSKRVVVFAEQI